MVSETILDIARLMKSPLEKLLDSLLRSRPNDRGNAYVPLGRDFVIGRQASDVDEALGLADRPFVERSDAGCQSLDKIVEFRVGQRTVHIAVELGEIGWNVVGTQEHFQYSSAADPGRQPSHWAA